MTDLIWGIDLSHNNANVNLTVAKAAGVQFVWHKATQGTKFTDPMFAERKKECHDVGLPFGAYHFGTDEDADQQAKFFLAIAGDTKALALDWEDNTTRTMSAPQALTFMQAICAGASGVFSWTCFLPPR